jgi:hypothetical protein
MPNLAQIYIEHFHCITAAIAKVFKFIGLEINKEIEKGQPKMLSKERSYIAVFSANRLLMVALRLPNFVFYVVF